jgi:hypothetical protein
MAQGMARRLQLTLTRARKALKSCNADPNDQPQVHYLHPACRYRGLLQGAGLE